MMPYYVYHVDEGLDMFPLETIHQFSYIHLREYSLDEGCKFILRDNIAYYALPGLIDDGCTGESVHISCEIMG